MENEIKVIRGFAVSMGNDYVEFSRTSKMQRIITK